MQLRPREEAVVRRPHQIVGQRSPRRRRETEEAVILEASAQVPEEPVPDVTGELQRVAVIVAIDIARRAAGVSGRAMFMLELERSQAPENAA